MTGRAGIGPLAHGGREDRRGLRFAPHGLGSLGDGHQLELGAVPAR